MKRFLMGILVGVVLLLPASVAAVSRNLFDGLPIANDIYQFNCDSKYSDGRQCNHAAVFDDQDNKCYVTYDPAGRQSSISCVKR